MADQCINVYPYLIGGGSGGGTGWAGVVVNKAALPAATGSGDVYLVQNSTGVLWPDRKGLYEDKGPGIWERLSNATFIVNDAESKIVDDVDNTKEYTKQLSSVPTSTAIVESHKGNIDWVTGVVEGSLMKSDALGNFSPTLIVPPQPGAVEAFDLAGVEGNQNMNNGNFQGFIKLTKKGLYDSVSFVTDNLNLGAGQFYTVRVAVYDKDLDIIEQGSLILNNTTDNVHTVTLDNEITIATNVYTYWVIGVNDNAGGGAVPTFRSSANGVNDQALSFQFTNATGTLPLDLTPVAKNNNSNIFHRVLYKA